MTRWGNSLAGRMLLMLAAALLIGQAVNFGVLLGEVRARRESFIEGGAVARAADTVERVASGLPLARIDGRGPDRLTIAIGAPAAWTSPRDSRFEARLVQALSEAGQRPVDVRATRAEDQMGREQLLIAVKLGDGRWVNLSSRLPPGDKDLIAPALGQTLVLFVALLGAVFLIVRHVARPLEKLGQAAEQFGSAGSPGPVRLEGPADVQRLVATFNRMQTRILDMLREKDRMLGAIGHDLRTPLASLRLRTEGVEDQAERQRMIETIEEMAHTLEDILSLARLGRSSEPLVPIDLGALADALVQDLQDLGHEAIVAADFRLLILGRPVLLRRALRNLIENAVKYGNCASVQVEQAGGHALVLIDDQGPGIPDADLESVMEGFVRLDGSRNRASGGSGLGLTIARSIVNEHGGSLSLANLPTGGLRVTVRLPLRPTA